MSPVLALFDFQMNIELLTKVTHSHSHSHAAATRPKSRGDGFSRRSLVGSEVGRLRPSSQVDPFEDDGCEDSEREVQLSRSRDSMGMVIGSPKARTMPPLLEREPKGRASSIVRQEVLVEAMSELEDGDGDEEDNVGEEKATVAVEGFVSADVGHVADAVPRASLGGWVVGDAEEGKARENKESDDTVRMIDDTSMWVRRSPRTVS